MAADGGDGNQNDNDVDASDSQPGKCAHTPELHCEKIGIRVAVKVSLARIHQNKSISQIDKKSIL